MYLFAFFRTAAVLAPASARVDRDEVPLAASDVVAISTQGCTAASRVFKNRALLPHGRPAGAQRTLMPRTGRLDVGGFA